MDVLHLRYGVGKTMPTPVWANGDLFEGEVIMSDGKMTSAQAGALGGRATVKKYGRAHMAEIGKVGFQVTTDRHFGGDREAHAEYLRQHGAFNYAQSTGLPNKGIWPTDAPAHPAHEGGE